MLILKTFYIQEIEIKRLTWMTVMDKIFDAAIRHDLRLLTNKPRNLKLTIKSLLFGKHSLQSYIEIVVQLEWQKWEDKLTWKLEGKIKLNNQISFFK